MENPLISVIMPVFNSESYVAKAVESILSQSFREFEFIIINDGSNDGTLNILETYAASDSRIRLISRSNTGLTIALNEGLKIARGDFIARMDSDDVSYPYRFKLQYDYLLQHPEVVALGGFVLRIDEDGWPINLLRRPQTHEEIDNLHLMGLGGGIIHPSAMIRKRAIQTIDGYRPESEPAEDLDLFLRLGEIGKLSNIPEVVLQFRVNSSGVSQSNTSKQIDRAIFVIKNARQRRGLPPRQDHRSVSFSSGDFQRRMILEALSGGNSRTAWKHLKIMARTAPCRFFSVKWILLCLRAGCMSSFIKRA
jgi:glycosyltransferase involved in cell wall biosynthesis